MLRKSNTRYACSAVLATTLLAINCSAFAHTGILSLPVAPKSGQGAYLTGLTITHGCSASQEGQPPSPQKPVVAVTAVLPNSSTAVATKVTLGATEAENTSEPITDISSMIEGAVGGGLPTLAPALIQDGSIWTKNGELVDDNGVVRGFRWTEGKMKPNLYAYPPFRITIPKFTDACLKRLRIRAAVANYCTTQSGADANARADIWYGHLTPLFNDADIQPEDYYPTLTVERDTERDGALGSSCGRGFELVVQPADADVDKFLPLKGYWPENAGATN